MSKLDRPQKAKSNRPDGSSRREAEAYFAASALNANGSPTRSFQIRR